MQQFIILAFIFATLLGCAGRSMQPESNTVFIQDGNYCFINSAKNKAFLQKLNMDFGSYDKTYLKLKKIDEQQLEIKIIHPQGDILAQNILQSVKRDELLEIKRADLTLFEQKLLWLLGESKTILKLTANNNLKVAISKQKIGAFTGFPIYSGENYDFYIYQAVNCKR